MDRKGQVIILSLWILIILTALAISLGHKVSMALRTSGYQKNRLQALYLAKAGLNRAISEINNDSTPDFDGTKDNWADNKEVFGKISFSQAEDEYASVNYQVSENEQTNTVFGARDEERKININTAPRELLEKLLSANGASNAPELSNSICAWRGGAGPEITIPDYKEAGYSNKGALFSSLEELILVQGMDKGLLNKIKDLVTGKFIGKTDLIVNDPLGSNHKSIFVRCSQPQSMFLKLPGLFFKTERPARRNFPLERISCEVQRKKLRPQHGVMIIQSIRNLKRH